MKTAVVGVQLALCVLFFFQCDIALGGDKNEEMEPLLQDDSMEEVCDDEYCDDAYCDDEYCNEEYCNEEYCNEEYCNEEYCDDEYCDDEDWDEDDEKFFADFLDAYFAQLEEEEYEDPNYGLPDEEVKKLRILFDKIDVNNDGVITKDELGARLEKLNRPYTDEKLQRIINSADRDGDGTISFDEFKRKTAMVKADEFETAMLKETFNEIDLDQDGFISEEEFKEHAIRLNIQTDDEDIKESIRVADKDGDGKLSFKEFRTIMKKQEEKSLIEREAEHLREIINIYKQLQLIEEARKIAKSSRAGANSSGHLKNE